MKYVSIDVECVATGSGHNDHAPCSVSAVDYDGNTIYQGMIYVDNIFSPLTVITGLTVEDVKKGRPFDVVQGELLEHLGSDVVLVGQSIENDIEYMQLTAGVDFHSSYDLADKFKAWNPRFQNHNYFSLAKEAYGLLGVSMQTAAHDPTTDARISMSLFRRFCQDPLTLTRAKQKLFNMQCKKKFPESMMRRAPAAIDGVCPGKYNPKVCFCGQPTSQNNVQK